MADVRVLHGKPAADASLVTALKQLLAEAEAGELASFVGVADYHSGQVDYVTAGVADWWAMSARLVDLSRDITIDDGDDE